MRSLGMDMHNKIAAILIPLIVLTIGAIFFISCTPATERKIQDYCKTCGGVKSAFVTDTGTDIMCMDGSILNQRYQGELHHILLGNCK